MLQSRINGSDAFSLTVQLPPSYWTGSLRRHLNSLGSIQPCCAGTYIRTLIFNHCPTRYTFYSLVRRSTAGFRLATIYSSYRNTRKGMCHYFTRSSQCSKINISRNDSSSNSGIQIYLRFIHTIHGSDALGSFYL